MRMCKASERQANDPVLPPGQEEWRALWLQPDTETLET